MSYENITRRAAVRSHTLAKDAAQDGLVGACFGLLLACVWVASDRDVWRGLADSAHPFMALTLVVAQSALVAGFGGWAVRKWAGAN